MKKTNLENTLVPSKLTQEHWSSLLKFAKKKSQEVLVT